MATFSNPHPFRNLKHIALQGGEPLMEEKNLELLQKFVDWGLARQITIDLSTNGSILSKQIQDLIPKFKSVDMYISIEAVGELYQYIRGGTHFSVSDLERNLYQFRRISNLNIFFAVTTSVYNILYLSPLLEWFDGIRQAGEEMVMSNTVVRPEYLSFHILPKKLKALARQRLQELSGTKDLAANTSRRFGDAGRGLIVRNLQKELYTPVRKRELIDQFLSFNRAIDELRGTSLLDVAPDLALLFDTEQLERVLSEEIYLTGGEPFLSLEQSRLLTRLVEQGRASSVILRYNTNLTTLPEKLIGLWKHFKLIRLNISFDGHGELSDYIRYPSRWEQLESHFKTLIQLKKNGLPLELTIHTTVQMYNITRLHQSVAYFWDQYQMVPYMNLLNHPFCLNIRVLPENLKATVLKNLQPFMHNKSIAQIANYLSGESWNRTYFSQFISYTQKLDQMRGQNFLNLCPEFENFFGEQRAAL